MKPSTMIRSLVCSKHRPAVFAKCGLSEFEHSASAALLIEIYLDGGSTLLKDCHYDGRNEKLKLCTMGMAIIRDTNEIGLNHRVLREIVLTPRGMETAKNAVEVLEKISYNIQRK